MPPVPGPCARCGYYCAGYWRPTPDCDERWPLCAECMAELHEDEAKRAVFVAAVRVEWDLAHPEAGAAEMEN